MTNTGTEAYLRTQVLTAPPERLQLMLYDGAIKFASQAKDRMAEGNFEASCDLLIRSQRITLEMLTGLRHDLNPGLCGKLAAIYTFIYRRLVEANVYRDRAAIDDALEVLAVQRGIWLELLDKLSAERGEEALEGAGTTGAAGGAGAMTQV